MNPFIKELTSTISKKLVHWFEAAVDMLPNAVVAFATIIFFWFLAKLAQALTAKAFAKINSNKAARQFVAIFVRLSVIFCGLLIALSVMDLNRALASVLAGAGVVGLALGFAFQDLASNLISGVGLALHHDWPFKIGDLVETNGELGEVRNISLRTTTIQTVDGKLVVLPNKQIFQDKLINLTLSGKRRVDIECGVSYRSDLERVKEVTLAAIEQIPSRDPSSESQVFFKEFSDSSINFVARFWINYAQQADYFAARDQAIIRIKKAFDENDIVIPFPIRTLEWGAGTLPLQKVDA